MTARRLDLLRELGYPVSPVAVNAAEWRKAGVEVPCDGVQLAVRMPRFDCYVAAGVALDDESVTRFLKSLHAWNSITHFVLVTDDAIYDHARGKLRRLDLDGSPHALERVTLLALADGCDPARLFDRALDREALTRVFFERFRDAVADVAAALRERVRDSNEAIRGEALLILSRLLFLYFIQQKGWLNGERRFLVDRLDRGVRNKREFFATVLLPLFFGCLNTAAKERDAAARKLGAIPYLNGGLFEPSAFELRHPDLHLPNDVMQRTIEGVFEKFSFRSDERDAAGVHVDPEMLGRVFESLMAADERAASGSFYTPREIVDVLTERAILEWCGDGDVAKKLESITILDPACGSGAFLLSALVVIERLIRAHAKDVPPDLRQRIVERSLFGVDLKPEAVRLCELRLWLAIVSGSEGSIDQVRPLPNLDRNILQGNSLLSPTDFLGDARASIWREWVTALRAQRDLVSRYRTAPQEERPALARLLRGSDREIAAALLQRAIELDEHELQQLAMPERDLFGRQKPPDLERCAEVSARIDATRRTLDRVDDGELGFFSFDVHFAHVIGAGGFDVVVGNPPWIRSSRIDRGARRMYSERYRLFRGDRNTPFQQPDASVAFFERALSLAGRDGVVALLLPSKVLNAAYAAPLRRYVEATLDVVAIDDWSDDAPHFDADTFPLGLTVRRRRGREQAIAVRAGGDSFTLHPSELSCGGEWSLVPPYVGVILRRLRAKFPALAEVLRREPLMGVKTGDNRRFFLDVVRVRAGAVEIAEGITIPIRHVCRCVRGRDVRRWSGGASMWMLWPPKEGWGKRLPKWLKRLAEIRGVDARDLRLSYVRAEHVGIKVAWKDLARGVHATVLPDFVSIDTEQVPLVPNQTLYSIDAASRDEAYALAAVLNSTVVNALVIAVAERAKDAHYRCFGRTIARLPLPEFDVEAPEWSALVRCSRRAHQGADVNSEVDRIVRKLYGVSAAELALLAAFVKRRT